MHVSILEINISETRCFSVHLQV